MKEFRLVRLRRTVSRHVSLDIVNEFEESILRMENIKTVPEFGNKYLRKIARPYVAGILNSLTPKNSFPVFCISMGVSEACRSIPFSFFSSDNIMFLFDAWPKYFPLISKIVNSYNIATLFVTSRDSANELSTRLGKTKVFWCPEGCDPAQYKPFDYKNKDIDVLQFGRKYDFWHNKVVGGFRQRNISYLYEKARGEIVFSDRTDFLNGLGRTRISVCFPMNITDNGLSGGISTMTNRYIQSMASKCLIVGAKPLEMNYIFDYDPIIEIDYSDPVKQISDILENFSDYIPLIEKNYQECITKHTWQDRWKMIKETLNNE